MVFAGDQENCTSMVSIMVLQLCLLQPESFKRVYPEREIPHFQSFIFLPHTIQSVHPCICNLRGMDSSPASSQGRHNVCASLHREYLRRLYHSWCRQVRFPFFNLHILFCFGSHRKDRKRNQGQGKESLGRAHLILIIQFSSFNKKNLWITKKRIKFATAMRQ